MAETNVLTARLNLYAADLADKTSASAIKNGISEHHDFVSGKAMGVPDYSA